MSFAISFVKAIDVIFTSQVEPRFCFLMKFDCNMKSINFELKVMVYLTLIGRPINVDLKCIWFTGEYAKRPLASKLKSREN